MGVLNNSMWNVASGASNFYEHQIAKSFRWDSGYLKWTPGSAGNRQVWTFSCWVKKAIQPGNTDVMLLNAGSSGAQSSRFRAYWYGDLLRSSSADANYNVSSGVYRDPSAWMHIVWKLTGGTSTQYVNGTSVSTSSVSGDVAINNNVEHTLGRKADYATDTRFKGCIAEVVFIDGTAHDPDDFAETKNGVWVPKDPSGLTFGSQGYYLDFADASAPGNDVSGNNNDWTNVNLATHDQVIDSPTFGSSSSGNFPLWSPLIKGLNAASLTEGNTRMDCSTGGKGAMTSWAIPTGTKYYIECLVEHVTNFNIVFGIANPLFDISDYDESDASMNGILFRANSASSWDTCSLTNGSRGSFGSNVGQTAGRVLAMTVNRVDNEIKMYLDNSLKHTISISATEVYHVACTTDGGDNASVHMNINAGHDSTGAGDFSAGSATDENGFGNFQHAPPSGFLALCSANLPTAESIDPAETDDNFPQKLFKTVLYTGNDSGQTVTFGFKPDWLSIKMRGNTGGGYPAQFWDTTRGDDYYIYPSGTALSVTSGTDYLEFVSTGFKTDESWDGMNHNGELYVAHGWRANGGTTSTNSNGSVNSTVQVDPSGHFSIVKWTGTSDSWSNAITVGHGLSSAPSVMWCKKIAGNTDQWEIFHDQFGNGGGSSAAHNSIRLDGTAALYTNQSYKTFGGVMPTSTVFTVDGNNLNGSSDVVLAYCFANLDGYIHCGSYEGNGNADGTFVYTGFSPAFIVCKSIDSTSDWYVFDNKREGYNVDNDYFEWNDSTQEQTTDVLDILSNGFKFRNANDPNVAETYIYLAMAHNPFKYATAR